MVQIARANARLLGTACAIAFAARLGIEQLVDVRDLGALHVCGRSVGKQSLIHVEVALRHDSIGESRLEFLSTSAAADFPQAFDCIHHLGLSLAQKSRCSIAENFGDRASTSRDDGSPAGQGLDHHQTERLGPIDREEQRRGSPEQLCFGSVADLAEKLNVGHGLEKRADLRLEVCPVSGIDLRRDTQRKSCIARHSHRRVDALLGGDSADERQIAVGPFAKRIQGLREAVRDGGEKRNFCERRALCIADGDQCARSVFTIAGFRGRSSLPWSVTTVGVSTYSATGKPR